MITRSHGTITDRIKIGYQYQWKILNRPDLEPYFLIKRDRIKSTSFLEQELLVHEILKRLQTTKLPPCQYESVDYENSIERIRTTTNCFFNGIITLYPPCNLTSTQPSKPFVETFYEHDDIPHDPDDYRTSIKHALTCDRILYVAIQKVIKTTKWDVTVWSIRRMLSRMKYGPKYLNPIVYKTIFRQLLKPAGRTISDLTPGLGSKAIACAILGAKYHPMAPFPVEMAESLNLQLVDVADKHDILLIDNSFKRVDIDKAMEWRPKCREMLVYAEHDQMDAARKKYRPTQIIKIKTKAITPKVFTPNYLLHFR